MFYTEIKNRLEKDWKILRTMISCIRDVEINEEHILSLCIQVIQTKHELCHGGSFCQAICDNDLNTVLSHGDQDALRSLKLFAYVRDYIYIEDIKKAKEHESTI